MRKGTYIVLIVILIVFLGAMYLLFGKDNISKDRYSTTFIIGDKTIWNYSSRSWGTLQNYKNIGEINWKKFTVYEDNKKLGNYLVWYDDKWYFFTDSKEAVMTNGGKILAYNSNHPIKVADFKEEVVDSSDKDIVDFVLSDHDLSTSSKFTVSKKITMDLDNDEEQETIYCLSNAFATEFIPDTVFSYVVVKDGTNVYYLYESTEDNKGTNSCRPFIHHIIDVNNDNKYEIIVSCGYYSAEQQLDMLYQLEEDKENNTTSYKIAISNQ
jgi:hypothetical protein